MKRAGEVLSAFFDREFVKKAQETGDLFTPAVWQDLLDSCKLLQGTSHTRIADLDNSILLVEADHPCWIQLLHANQKKLLRSVQKRFPEISLSGISFRLSK